MKYLFGLALLVMAIVTAVGLEAAQLRAPKTEDTSSQTSDEQAIRQSARLFTEAFNRADSRAIGALFTSSAEYRTADGRVLRGRGEIEVDFRAFFEQNRGIQIGTAIDSLHLLGQNVAAEEGRTWTLRSPVGAPLISRYSVIHTKEGGRWLVASVRETDEELPSNYSQLKDLEWMVGTWTAESQGTQIQTTFEWIANKNFMKRTYSTHRNGENVSSGTQIIGWDAAAGQITSWMFDSSGGHGRAAFSKEGHQIVIKANSTLTDGSSASATYVITPVDGNHFTWISTNRSINGEQLADVAQVTVVRSGSSTITRSSAVNRITK